jgi:thioredoxin-related protein/YHS domain-containing protein
MSGLRIFNIKRVAIAATLCFLTCNSASAQLPWQGDVRAALKQAKASGKPMMIQFTADWCTFCHKMKATTFTDPAVVQQVNAQFIPVMLDADQHAELVEKLALKGLPATVVVDPDLRILKKLNGFQRPDKLMAELGSVVAARRKVASVGYSKTRKTQVRVSRKNPGSLPKVTQKAQPSKAKATPKPPTRTYAFGGLCLVSLRNDRTLLRGNPRFALKYRGTTVSFATKMEMEAFQDNPDIYWPKHDGVCQVSARDGKTQQGRPEFGVMFRDEVWLFSSAETMNRFVENPELYVSY